MPLLAVSGLTVRVASANGPLTVLDAVEFSCDAGDSIGLVGESGCGKSMTALAVMGLLPASATVSGRICLGDTELLTLTERDYCRVRGRRLAMVFQEPMTALNPVQTIGTQVIEGMRVQLGLGRFEAERRARRLLDRVGLTAPRFSLASYPHQLSGGQRQRVVIAIALACEPQLLIADEPTTALDVVVQEQIMRLILELAADAGMGLLLITHDLGVVAASTDKVYVMYAGRIVERAATESLFSAPRHPYTRGLLAAVPQWAEPTGRLATVPGQVPPVGHRPPGCAFADRCTVAEPRCSAQRPVLPAGKHAAACLLVA